MNKVVEILMSRDGISQEEAEALVETTREDLMMCDFGLGAEGVIMNNLGLEADYLFDILDL